MQIQPSATRLGAPAAIGTPTASPDAAGFASLLRARLPTPEPTLAAPAPVRPPPRAQAEAAPVPPMKTAPAPVSEKAAADPPEPTSAPATEAPADATASTTTPTAAPATPTAEAALRSQLRARLRAADAMTPPTVLSRSDAAAPADPVPSMPTDADAPRASKKTDPAATLPDTSTLPLPVGTAVPVTPAADASSVPSDAPATGAGEARTQVSAAATTAAATEPDGRTGGAGPVEGAPPSGAAFTAVLAEHRSAALPGESTRRSAVDAATPTAPGALAFGTAPLPGTAAPQAVAVATPVDAPNFAQHLGVQLSVLAKDGVQHAELHLNPADMGPVSVQITMDGTQARIDFGADVAATRQAIESGLPQLAGALADAGFTLAGGGVSSHAGGRGGSGGGGQPGSGNAQTRATGIAATEAAAPAARRVVSMGGLDLYA